MGNLRSPQSHKRCLGSALRGVVLASVVLTAYQGTAGADPTECPPPPDRFAAGANQFVSYEQERAAVFAQEVRIHHYPLIEPPEETLPRVVSQANYVAYTYYVGGSSQTGQNTAQYVYPGQPDPVEFAEYEYLTTKYAYGYILNYMVGGNWGAENYHIQQNTGPILNGAWSFAWDSYNAESYLDEPLNDCVD